MLKAEIYITLKQTVADPQGETVKHALGSMGYKGLEGVRMGKLVTITLNHRDKKKAGEQIESMCAKLLANPIIEDYRYRIKKV